MFRNRETVLGYPSQTIDLSQFFHQKLPLNFVRKKEVSACYGGISKLSQVLPKELTDSSESPQKEQKALMSDLVCYLILTRSSFKMRILVVEDQVKMANFLKRGLNEVGYAIDIAESGQAAEMLVATNDYDLLILDVMLPDQNGLDTARHLRRDGFEGPILMLTALSTTKDKVHGLDAGADDYLTKPYAFDELLARVRALLRRRGGGTGNSSLKYGDLELDLVQRVARRQGKDISLTAKEFALLEYLLRNPERPLGRVSIAEHVWDIHFDSESNVIDVYINLLRKKVDTPFPKKMIHTVVGVGYVLKES